MHRKLRGIHTFAHTLSKIHRKTKLLCHITRTDPCSRYTCLLGALPPTGPESCKAFRLSTCELLGVRMPACTSRYVNGSMLPQLYLGLATMAAGADANAGRVLAEAEPALVAIAPDAVKPKNMAAKLKELGTIPRLRSFGSSAAASRETSATAASATPNSRQGVQPCGSRMQVLS